jgi:hypothetical protein
MDAGWFGAWANIAVAVATAFLGIIAIFQQKIARWLVRPQLALSGAAVYTPWAVSGGPVLGIALFLHLRLANSGNGPAQDVEASVEEVYQRQPAGTFVRVREASYPQALVWSDGFRRTTMPFVNPETTKVVDVGHVHDPAKRPDVEEPPEPTTAKTPTLALEAPAPPYNRSHAFAPGTYRLHAVVTASNMKPLHTTLDIEVTGAWSETDAGAVVRYSVKEGWASPA